jgi:hypothetical protein
MGCSSHVRKDGIFERDAMIAERIVGFYLDVL